MSAPPRAVPAEVGVIGFGYYTATVLDLLAEAGTPVAFVADERDGADDRFGAGYAAGVRGIPVLSAAEFAARVANGPVELFAGRVECDPNGPVTDEPFARIAAWVRRIAGDGATVRHPTALLDRVPPAACSDRYAIFGFPGSGNVLTQSLASGLFADRTLPPSSTWLMRAGLSEHHFYSVAATVRAAAVPLAPTMLDFVPHEFGTMMVRAECGAERAAVAFDVPCGRHHGVRTYVTHSRPTAAAVAFYAAAGAPCVAVVRHPCETLLSQANKIARPARVMLGHPHFLDRAAALLADWTAELLANRDRVRVVRYEDMANRDAGELRALAEWLGVPLDEAGAGALFDAHLNRNLRAAVPTHYYRGGSDKWRGELSPDDLRRVLARVPAEAFTAFGYEVPTETDLVPVPFAGTPAPIRPRFACQLEAFPLRPVPGGFGIQIAATDPDTADGLASVLRDPAVLALFAAAGRPPAVHPLSP